jgi:hypothetical protein
MKALGMLFTLAFIAFVVVVGFSLLTSQEPTVVIADRASGEDVSRDHEAAPAAITAERAADQPVSNFPSNEKSSSASGPPRTRQEAAALLGTDPTLLEPFGVHGWVVYGDVPAIPSGVCVDWPPSSGTLRGEAAWSVTKGADWERTLLAGPGSFRGPKVTLYWSPCQP